MTEDPAEGVTVPEDEEPQFEMTAEEATSLDPAAPLNPAFFNRKKTLVVITCVIAAFVMFGVIISSAKSKKKNDAEAEYNASAGSSSADFLNGMLNRAASQKQREDAAATALEQRETQDNEAAEQEPALPQVSFNPPPDRQINYPQPQNQPPQPPQNSQPQADPTHFKSPLVPQMEGSLFARNIQPQPAYAAAASAQNAPDYYSNYAASQPPPRGQASEYALQNDQQGKQAFYDPSGSGGAAFNGQFLGENSLWTGTVIPGILETEINTDLPGNVLARVTQNVYDSQTGRKLLIPQGTVLVAKYNSSVSYAQSRVQIVWDTLIRPDGFQLDMDGANGVDKSGMSGQSAQYREHWFEYLKAAGIITLFSVANSKMTETAAQYAASDASSANIAEANSQLVNQLGGNMAARAMNIQPTLTVKSGTLINIMLNKTLYLPPLDRHAPSQKYTLE